MLPKDIHTQLFKVNQIEKEQLQNNGENLLDIVADYFPKKIKVSEMPYFNYFDFGKIAVNKSSRFSFTPAHRHKFIEMNYCYLGQSSQFIDDKVIKLKPGQLLIMDRAVQHRLSYARKQDILLNILIRDNYEISQVLDSVESTHNLMAQLLSNALRSDFNHDNFLIFDLNKVPIAQRLVESIIIAGINNKGKNNLLLETLTKSMILSMEKVEPIEKTDLLTLKENKEIVNVIQYLNTHYKTITLNSLAEHFGYNSNYLGNKITKVTGHTFKDLLQIRRLNVACNLLQKTNKSIEEISSMLGYENHSSLFRIFKKYLNTTPSEYKKNMRLPHDLDGLDIWIPKSFLAHQSN